MNSGHYWTETMQVNIKGITDIKKVMTDPMAPK